MQSHMCFLSCRNQLFSLLRGRTYFIYVLLKNYKRYKFLSKLDSFVSSLESDFFKQFSCMWSGFFFIGFCTFVVLCKFPSCIHIFGTLKGCLFFVGPLFQYPLRSPTCYRDWTKRDIHSLWLRQWCSTWILVLRVGFWAVANTGFQQWSNSYSLNAIDP